MSDADSSQSSRRGSHVNLVQDAYAPSSTNNRTNPRSCNNSSVRQHHSEEEEEMPSSATKYNDWVRPLIAEFVGQLMFAFLHSSTANTITVTDTVLGNALLPAVSDGLTVAILVITIGGISGAHVNFAVTVAVALGGGMKLLMVPFYLIAQILGSLAGAGLATAVSGGAFGQFALGSGVSIGQGLLMEVMLTAFLTLAVLMAAVELNAAQAAFAIGFTILIDILAGFNISGGCMNPTLSFGPAVVAGEWTNYWIYWVGPIIGATISALIFRIFLGDKSRVLFRVQRQQLQPSPPSTPDDLKMEKNLPEASYKTTEPRV